MARGTERCSKAQLFLRKAQFPHEKPFRAPILQPMALHPPLLKEHGVFQWLLPIHGKRQHFKEPGKRLETGWKTNSVSKGWLKRLHLFERRHTRRGTNSHSLVTGRDGISSHPAKSAWVEMRRSCLRATSGLLREVTPHTCTFRHDLERYPDSQDKSKLPVNSSTFLARKRKVRT